MIKGNEEKDSHLSPIETAAQSADLVAGQVPDLKDCPFCGGKAAWGEGEQKQKYGNEQVYCINCYAMTAPEMSKGEAATRWDTRADSDVAKLREALRNLLAWEQSTFTDIPPYGHDCRWCIKCVERVKVEASAVLANTQDTSAVSGHSDAA